MLQRLRLVQVAKTELRQKLLMCTPGMLWLVLMFSKAHKVCYGIVPKSKWYPDTQLDKQPDEDTIYWGYYVFATLLYFYRSDRFDRFDRSDRFGRFECPKVSPKVYI